MPLSFADAFMYEEKDLFSGFNERAVYRIHGAGSFELFSISDGSLTTKILNNIKLYFPDSPSNEWIDELIFTASEEGELFEFLHMEVLLQEYIRIDKKLLYTCIEKSLKELLQEKSYYFRPLEAIAAFENIRFIFNKDDSGLSIYYYSPGTSLTSDEISRDIHNIVDEILYLTNKNILDGNGGYIDDNIAIASSLLTGHVYMLIMRKV